VPREVTPSQVGPTGKLNSVHILPRLQLLDQRLNEDLLVIRSAFEAELHLLQGSIEVAL